MSKREKISRVSRSRLPDVVCVLEGLYDLGNIGAVGESVGGWIGGWVVTGCMGESKVSE